MNKRQFEVPSLISEESGPSSIIVPENITISLFLSRKNFDANVLNVYIKNCLSETRREGSYAPDHTLFISQSNGIYVRFQSDGTVRNPGLTLDVRSINCIATY